MAAEAGAEKANARAWTRALHLFSYGFLGRDV